MVIYFATLVLHILIYFLSAYSFVLLIIQTYIESKVDISQASFFAKLEPCYKATMDQNSEEEHFLQYNFGYIVLLLANIELII